MRSVHALPVTFVGIKRQLAIFCQLFQGSSLQDAILFKIAKDGTVKDKETTTDQPSHLRLFLETHDQSRFVRLHHTKAREMMHAAYGGDFPTLAMVIQQGIEVNVRHTIAVGGKESILVNVFLDAFNAPPGGRLQSGIGQGDAEIFVVAVVKLDVALSAQHDRKVAVHGFVVEKVPFDDLALVTQAEDEILVPVMGIGFHNVPQDRPATDGDHWFRSELRLVSHAGALAAAENDNFHRYFSRASSETCAVI